MNDSAATCYKEGVEVAQRSGYDEGLAYLYNNLAVLYYEMERYDEGVEYSLKAKNMRKKGRRRGGIFVGYGKRRNRICQERR